MRYSPDGNCLAVGCKEMVIDLYHVAGAEYLPVAVCKGHSGAVSHLGRNSETSAPFFFLRIFFCLGNSEKSAS